jgi:uncharacterized protein (TIGR00290 family)
VALNTKVIFSWSGGKDSALALYELRKNKDCEIQALLTTITEGYDRASMHGVRRALVEEQARSLGLPLEKVFIAKHSSNDDYESKMRHVLEKNLALDISSVAFGDIFLEDLRKYREDKLSVIGMKAIFPIWKKDTSVLARLFIELGFKAIVTCVDSNVLDKMFVGRVFDEQFISDLPSSVDPCGENGEFHSFVYDGPIFRHSVPFKKGEIVLRDKRFYYCDLL